jgi:hypothetical protein
VAVVCVPDDFPEGWDVADPLPPGVTIETLHELLTQAMAEAPQTEAPPPEPAAVVHTEAARAQIAKLAALERHPV